MVPIAGEGPAVKPNSLSIGHSWPMAKVNTIANPMGI
jgi:hypothetical protein